MAEPYRRLVIVRHAKSGWPDGVPDEDRPLAERGRLDAPAVGRWLRDQVDRVDLVLCSPARRARQTWQLIEAELPAPPPARSDERLYGAGTDHLLAIIHALPAEAGTALIVGHNPGLQDLVLLLGGEPVEMNTAAVAVLGWPGAWADAGPRAATLEARAKPRG
ncbi:MAG TPA: histidine phosphatase family protein [Mycobacteriales bacterium]|nr:histidine phosphatase family protein [Mycobacteriales bacterium]